MIQKVLAILAALASVITGVLFIHRKGQHKQAAKQNRVTLDATVEAQQIQKKTQQIETKAEVKEAFESEGFMYKNNDDV